MSSQAEKDAERRTREAEDEHDEVSFRDERRTVALETVARELGEIRKLLASEIERQDQQRYLNP